MSDVLARDMGRKISGVIKDAMEREMAIAQHVLEPVDQILIMMMVAKGALISAAATTAGIVPPAEREQLFNQTIDQIVSMVRLEWPTASQEIEKRYSRAGAA